MRASQPEFEEREVITRLLPLALASCLAATAAIAQTAPPTRIRGTIAAVEGQTLSVTTREGPKVRAHLDAVEAA
jgi:hypothetical protein